MEAVRHVFTGELWQLLDSLSWPRVWLVQPLQQQQALNVLVLLTVRLVVQAAVIGLGLFLFFVALGLITVQDGSAVFGVPVALFKVSAMLASFGGVSSQLPR